MPKLGLAEESVTNVSCTLEDIVDWESTIGKYLIPLEELDDPAFGKMLWKLVENGYDITPYVSSKTRLEK